MIKAYVKQGRFIKWLKRTLQWIGDNSGCHQKPERSFFIKGWQFPICARCTGVTVGQFAAVTSAICKKTASIPVAVFFLIIMGADWGIQEAGIKESTNSRRFVTGFLGGFGLYTLYVHVFKMLVYIWKRLKFFVSK